MRPRSKQQIQKMSSKGLVHMILIRRTFSRKVTKKKKTFIYPTAGKKLKKEIHTVPVHQEVPQWSWSLLVPTSRPENQSCVLPTLLLWASWEK